MKRNKYHKKTKEGDEWMRRITEIGCVVCLRQYQIHSPGEPHHGRDDATGRPVQDQETICLCPTHHRTGANGIAFHETGRKTWEKMYGTHTELLEYTRELVKQQESI